MTLLKVQTEPDRATITINLEHVVSFYKRSTSVAVYMSTGLMYDLMIDYDYFQMMMREASKRYTNVTNQ